MKFNDLLFDIVTEEFANKKVLNTMLAKWYGYGDNPPEEMRNEGEFLVSKFFEIKNKLNPNSPEVRTFLNRFAGFNPNSLKNVLDYNLQQIKFIVGEYFDLPGEKGEEDSTPEIFRGKDLPPTEERVEASKNLWFSETDNLIVNEPGFRVYKIRNRAESINWGYYNGLLSQEEPYRSQPHHMQWCTTRYSTGSNLYGGYRNRRTFYFVIDESKDPKVERNVQQSQYYISALQAADDSPTGLRLTSILNDGSDPVISQDDLVKIYPKIYNHLDKIVKVKYDQSELGEITDELDRVDEREGNDFAFWKIGGALKKRYIDAQRIITNPKSWETMTQQLKQSYIDYTENRTAQERFSTMDLLLKIKSNAQDTRSVDVRLKKIGVNDGVAYLITKIFQTNFRPARTSIDIPSLKIFESRTGNNKAGIFDESKGEWAKGPGSLVYEPEYTHIDTMHYQDNEGVDYIVEVYSKTMSPTDDSFYSIYSIKEDNPSFKGHFLSASAWKRLDEMLTNKDEIEKDVESDEPVSINKSKEFRDIEEWN